MSWNIQLQFVVNGTQLSSGSFIQNQAQLSGCSQSCTQEAKETSQSASFIVQWIPYAPSTSDLYVKNMSDNVIFDDDDLSVVPIHQRQDTKSEIQYIFLIIIKILVPTYVIMLSWLINMMETWVFRILYLLQVLCDHISLLNEVRCSIVIWDMVLCLGPMVWHSILVNLVWLSWHLRSLLTK